MLTVLRWVVTRIPNSGFVTDRKIKREDVPDLLNGRVNKDILHINISNKTVCTDWISKQR